jgi:general secretion pathway protein K
LSSASASAREGRERGIALLVVIWVLALLAVLIIGFSGDARTELLVARNHYESANARGIADAGVSLAIFGILDPAPEAQWPADGRLREVSYADGTIRIRIQDEGGKIDLNAAAPELLAGLLSSAGGLSPGDAGGLAQAIDQYRQAQQQADAPTARRGTLRTMVRRQANAFRVIEDLRLVAGVTREIYDRIAPFVTVYSGVGDIDPLTAPPEVLRSLPGVNAGEVEAFLAARAQQGPIPGQLPPLSGPVGGSLAHRVLQNATILSEGKTANGTTFTRAAVVSLSADPTARRDGPVRGDDASLGLIWTCVSPRPKTTRSGRICSTVQPSTSCPSLTRSMCGGWPCSTRAWRSWADRMVPTRIKLASRVSAGPVGCRGGLRVSENSGRDRTPAKLRSGGIAKLRLSAGRLSGSGAAVTAALAGGSMSGASSSI